MNIRDSAYFPLDEDDPVNPMDIYALSEICNERTAHAFQQRSGAEALLSDRKTREALGFKEQQSWRRALAHRG